MEPVKILTERVEDMKTGIITLGPIAVIGKEGTCTQGHNIVSQLWTEANSHFSEVAELGKKADDGSYAGFWGLMSDLGRQYLPWENDYSTGLYLAGMEVAADCPVPEGWVKWNIPKRTYFVMEIAGNAYQTAFRRGIAEELPMRSLQLSGAVCDYTEPGTGKNYLFFPCVPKGGDYGM